MKSYKTFILSDEPRWFGIPVISALPVLSLTVFGLLINKTWPLFIIGFIISLIVHFTCASQGIKYFLSLMYWHLPNSISSIIFNKFPQACNRIYMK